jgi:hypothetical protein
VERDDSGSVDVVLQESSVDDGVTSVEKETEAVHLIENTTNLLSRGEKVGKVNCHEIMSDSPQVLEQIQEDDLGVLKGDMCKTLGLSWDERLLDVFTEPVEKWHDKVPSVELLEIPRCVVPLVANRIQRVHHVSAPDQLYHVSGVDNPADEGSRGVHGDMWLNGMPLLITDYVASAAWTATKGDFGYDRGRMIGNWER